MAPQSMDTMLRVTREVLEWLPAPELDGTKEVLRIWTELQKDGIAHLRDLPSRHMATYLQNIIVWEPVEDWKDARVRLMGSALVFRFGGNIKGKLMSDVFSHIEKPQHVGMVRAAMRKGTPTFVKSTIRCGNMDLMKLELLLAPIRDVGNGQTLAMVYVQPHP